MLFNTKSSEWFGTDYTMNIYGVFIVIREVNVIELSTLMKSKRKNLVLVP